MYMYTCRSILCHCSAFVIMAVYQLLSLTRTCIVLQQTTAWDIESVTKAHVQAQGELCFDVRNVHFLIKYCTQTTVQWEIFGGLKIRKGPLLCIALNVRKLNFWIAASVYKFNSPKINPCTP